MLVYNSCSSSFYCTTILFPPALCNAILSQSNSIHYDSDVEAKIAYVSKQIANCVRFNNPDTSDEIENIIANKLIGRGGGIQCLYLYVIST
jgi:hypothetical protein